MATWTVEIEASFSDTIDVEAETEEEALELGVAEFEADYMVVNSFALSWDNVEAVSAERDDEDEDEDA